MRRGYYGAGAAAAVGAGAIGAGAYYGGYGDGSQQYYNYYQGQGQGDYYQGQGQADYYQGQASAADSSNGCAARFRSYNPATGTYLGYDGINHPCP